MGALLSAACTGQPDTVAPDDTAEDALPPDSVVVCDDPVPVAADGVCAVTPGSDVLWIRGTVLGEWRVWEDGGVLLDVDGTIACVGCDCADHELASEATVIDCAEGVISPGLVNSHDHISFSENPPVAPTTVRYDHRHEWRGSIPSPGNAHGSSGDSSGVRWVELRQLFSGTTALVGSRHADGMLRNPDEGGDANEGISLPSVDSETFPLGDQSETQRSDCDWDYPSTELEASREGAFVPHVSEGINDRAHEEFRCASSSFGGAQDLTEAHAAHVHGIGLTTTDYDLMRRNGTQLIWSPRSNISLYGDTARVTTLDALGGTIALGTDWSLSGSASLTRELACADHLDTVHYGDWFSDADLWRMATANAADAVGAGAWLGRLEAGAVGDIAVFDGREHAHHRAIVQAAADDVVLVLRGGIPLLGERVVLDDLGSDCEAIEVCGADHAVCVDQEYGVTLDALVAEMGDAYPAWFCDVPAGEPTCSPSRPDQYDGPTDADADGDGIADADDLCPDVFDPIRPLDDGQPDLDGDGVGDACDPTPLPADVDGDGVTNDDDNCPLLSNADQSDADDDAKGDACDACPDWANPASVCLPDVPAMSTIAAARRLVDVRVFVSGTVTAVGGHYYAIQDVSDPGAPGTGMHVFTGGLSPSVAVGDVVEVVGVASDYFDQFELAEEHVTVVGSGEVEPVRLTAADAASEDWEGMLVTVSGSVSDDAYDCGVDGSACDDDGLWEIDGEVVVYDRYYESGGWGDHVGELPVTGVMAYRWSRRRVLPRTAADFGG